MIAVIFELQPADSHRQEYLDTAADLRPILEQIEGFISVERFQSLANPTKLLSLSFFSDENAVQEWRALSEHRKAQTKGRNSIFDDYRLRVAQVIRDYGLNERAQAPQDSKKAHKP